VNFVVKKAIFMRVKICGMKYPDNILEALEFTLTQIIWIYLWEKSSRYFDGTILLYLIDKKSMVLLMKHFYYYPKVLKHDLQAVQLHGRLDFCQELWKQLPKGIEIIKVFSIQDEFDFSALKPFEEFCDYFLFDTKGKITWRKRNNFRLDKY
jgi:phosphoribosylanthranilate isomerase